MTVIPMPLMNACQTLSRNQSDMSMGGSIVRLKSISSRPKIRRMTRKLIVVVVSYAGRLLRKTLIRPGTALNVANTPLIDHKQNDMVAAFHPHVAMGDNDLFAPHDGADGGAVG